MKNLFDIQGRVVVITGGTGVLGRAIALHLADEGAKVVILGRKAEVGNALVDEIKANGGEALFLTTDVMDRERLEQNLTDILTAYGRVDALLNAAGGNMPGATIAPTGTFFDLKIEEFQRVLDLNLTGTVLALPDKSGEVQLQVGLMKMKQPLSALRAAGADSAPKKKEKTGKKTVSMAARSVPLEIDVRGQLPEEALDNVDKYLDDCMMAGLSEVSIVHGKGTGVLRNEIGQHLRKHPHVAEFRLGRYGEGETGVTIVTLK